MLAQTASLIENETLLTHMPALSQAQRNMKSDFDSDHDFDIQTSKHRDQNL
jgi:hypothetical protein